MQPEDEPPLHVRIAVSFAAVLDMWKGQSDVLGIAMIAVLKDGVVHQANIKGSQEAVIVLAEFVRGMIDVAEKANSFDLARLLEEVAEGIVDKFHLEKRGPLQ